jgi:hypothetical protein
VDVETITKLLDAGYTKEEISALDNPKPEGKPEEPKPDDKPKDTNEDQDKPKENETPEVNEAIAALTKTVEGLTATVKAMQDANVKGATGGKPDGNKVTDVMKSFIDTL